MKILLFILVFFIVVGQVEAEEYTEKESVYTIQVSSFSEEALDYNKQIANVLEKEGYEDVRIEKIGDFYTLRVGRYRTKTQAQEIYIALKKIYPQSILRNAYYIPERIIYPAPKEKIEKVFEEEKKETPVVTKEVPFPAKTPTTSGIKGKMPQVIFLVFLSFAILLLIPLLPGLRELIKPKDSSPLFIKMDYFKEPRYFDRSFKKVLEDGLQNAGYTRGIKQVQLHKEETVEVCESLVIPDGRVIENILYVKSDFVSGRKVHLKKEVYVKGTAKIGEENVMRAIAGDGDITLGTKTQIIRWVGTSGNIIVEEQCRLGIHCSCDGELKIGKGCIFKALYARPIITYDTEITEVSKEDEIESQVYDVPEEVRNIEDMVWYASKTFLSIPPFTNVEKDFVVKHNIILRKGCTVKGSIKSYGNVILEEGVNVNGNIFSEEEIIIGANCVVTGDIFSQNFVRIGKGFHLGKSGSGIKSIIAKKGIEITKNNVIFGYVLTEGEGRVV
jgi:predicted acyltransferase (DUF342 family)